MLSALKEAVAREILVVVISQCELLHPPGQSLKSPVGWERNKGTESRKSKTLLMIRLGAQRLPTLYPRPDTHLDRRLTGL